MVSLECNLWSDYSYFLKLLANVMIKPFARIIFAFGFVGQMKHFLKAKIIDHPNKLYISIELHLVIMCTHYALCHGIINLFIILHNATINNTS
jgi:hypothetical protein